MIPGRAARTTAFIVALALCALLVNIVMLWRELNLYSTFGGREDVTLYEERLQELKQILPPTGIVGYMTNRKPQPDFLELALSRKRFSLTQYVLSPVIVADTVERPLVVGDFHGTMPDAEALAGMNLVLVKDFGSGVMLFRKKDGVRP